MLQAIVCSFFFDGGLLHTRWFLAFAVSSESIILILVPLYFSCLLLTNLLIAYLNIIVKMLPVYGVPDTIISTCL